jgi:hypothetical protein
LIGSRTQDPNRDEAGHRAELHGGATAKNECHCQHQRSPSRHAAVSPMHAAMFAPAKTGSTGKTDFSADRMVLWGAE